MEEQKIVVMFARDRDCEELDGKLKLLMIIARGHRLAFIHEQKTQATAVKPNGTKEICDPSQHRRWCCGGHVLLDNPQ